MLSHSVPVFLFQGKGAKRNQMNNSVLEEMRAFNARRKLKGGMLGVMAFADLARLAKKS